MYFKADGLPAPFPDQINFVAGFRAPVEKLRAVRPPRIECPEFIKHKGFKQRARFHGRRFVPVQPRQGTLHAAIEQVKLGVRDLFDLGFVAVGGEKPTQQRVFQNAEIALYGRSSHAHVPCDVGDVQDLPVHHGGHGQKTVEHVEISDQGFLLNFLFQIGFDVRIQKFDSFHSGGRCHAQRQLSVAQGVRQREVLADLDRAQGKHLFRGHSARQHVGMGPLEFPGAGTGQGKSVGVRTLKQQRVNFIQQFREFLYLVNNDPGFSVFESSRFLSEQGRVPFISKILT